MSAVSCGFGHIYWRNLNGKLHLSELISWVELNSVWYLQTVPLLHLHVILFLQVLRSHCLPNKLNPFLAIIPILNPLKASENQWFFGVFRGYKMETVIRNGLTSKYPWLSFHVKLFILLTHISPALHFM